MKGKRGYTLVEMLIYIALLSLVTATVINSLFVMTKAWSRIKVEKNSNLSMMYAGELLSREIHNALSIDPDSQFNVNPGVLKLVTYVPGSTATTTTTFSVSGGQLMMQRGSDAPTPIVMQDVSVPYFEVNQFATTNSTAVRFSLQLISSYREVSKTREFGSTAIIRGLYSN